MSDRLFIGLEIPEFVKDQIEKHKKEIYGFQPGLRWEPKEKIHITLKFLGETEPSLVPEIKNRLRELGKDQKAFNLRIIKYGLFYRQGNPSILWAGLKHSPLLAQFADKINSELAPLGFRKENRKFKPHLTILRLKGNEDRRKIEDFVHYYFNPLTFTADNLVFFRSKLQPGGSVYKKIESIKLL